jgi:transposase InsO family protein
VDEASGLCQLTWHDRCRADDMVAAMQQWFVLFGIIPNWMSDQGPHYKDQVVEKLCRIYGAAHHFAPAHCPWSNGTVEVMMRSIRKTLQAMRVELRIAEDAVDSLLPVVKHAVNHTPSPKCNGRAPITAHTQQPPGNALSAYRSKEGIAELSPSLLEQWRESHWKELAAARDTLHRDVAAVDTAKRAKERDHRNGQPKARVIQLDVW